MPNFMDWSDKDALEALLRDLVAGESAFQPDEVERLAAWFRDKWRTGECPVCTHEEWIPNAKVSHLPNTNTAEDGTVFPVLFIFCRNCGYSMPINVRIAGIRPIERTSDDDAEPKS